MAKAKTAAAPKAKKKAAKAAKAVTLKAPPAGKKDKGGKKSRAKDAAEALWKLAEHPLIGELLAIGATAAVAAIAEQGLARQGKKKKNVSSKVAAKAAGTAAAAAIGQRLISEFSPIKSPKAARPAKATRPARPARRTKPAKSSRPAKPVRS